MQQMCKKILVKAIGYRAYCWKDCGYYFKAVLEVLDLNHSDEVQHWVANAQNNRAFSLYIYISYQPICIQQSSGLPRWRHPHSSCRRTKILAIGVSGYHRQFGPDQQAQSVRTHPVHLLPLYAYWVQIHQDTDLYVDSPVENNTHRKTLHNIAV